MMLVSVKIAAKELGGISCGKLYQLVRRKEIPFVKIGDRILLNVARVQTFLGFEPDKPAQRPSVIDNKGRRKTQ